MKALNLPNIVQLFEVIDTQETLVLMTEHLSRGDMFDYLQDHSLMTETEAQCIFQQLVSARRYCHQKGIIPRDPKPESVLFDAHVNIKTVNFRLNTQFTGNRLSTFYGSLFYAAPGVSLGLW